MKTDLQKLINLLITCEQELALKDSLSTAISSWSVYQQVDHLLTVCERVLHRLTTDKGETQLKPLTLLGRATLWTGWIPRGRADAPAEVLPASRSKAELLQLLTQLGAVLAEVKDSAKPICCSGFHHPLLGYLTGTQWLKFLTIHTKHHLKIIRDIRRHSQQSAKSVINSAERMNK